MPQAKATNDFALDRLRVLNDELAECLADSAILRARIVKAQDANGWFALRCGPIRPPTDNTN